MGFMRGSEGLIHIDGHKYGGREREKERERESDRQRDRQRRQRHNYNDRKIGGDEGRQRQEQREK